MGNSHGKPVVFTDQVNLNHFRLLRVVGKGAFGKVRIVERKDTGCTFALKYIRKDEVVRSESVRNIIRERRMLEHLNHPFLCNLRYSFQDVEYLYLVVDLMTGGDLRFHISRKSFTEDAVRFWIAQLGCALRYCHTQGIVHRDVKPDNVLLDQDGHVHLADFNVASDFKPEKPLTSKSGTLAYLAPEVYEGKGYLAEVDWWSLGVCFYECIYNKRPFEAHSHEGLSAKIRAADPPYPQTNPPVSTACLVTVRSLLTKDRSQRIGATGFETFTGSPFFRPLDFEALERKEIEPVFKPSSDKTNFDATYDLEELLLEEAPLEARARRQKPRGVLKIDATREEIRADELHRMIEKLFEPFDYTIALYDRPRLSENDSPLATGTANLSRPGTNSPTVLLSDSHQSQGPTALPLTYNRSVDTPKGSPPLPISDMSREAPRSHPSHDFFGATNPNADSYHGSNLTNFTQPQQQASSRPHSSRSTSNRRGGRPRKGTVGDGSGGNSDPSNVPDVPAIPTTAVPESMQGQRLSRADDKEKKPSGMLAFLSRKKGRERSPRSSKERGVLGKDGARVVVSQ